MKAPTHIAFGLLSATCAFSLAARSLPNDWPALGGVVLGSLLPDLDSPKSIIGRLLPFISLPIERRWGHRTLTHSLLALTAVGLVLLPLCLLSKTAYTGLLIGYTAHLLADCVTKTGVPLFYPYRARYILPRSDRFRFHSGSTGEVILCVVLLLLLVLVFPLSRAGGVWKALRELAGTQGMAYREYRSATTQTLLEFKGQWRTSRQPIEGRAPVLEATQSRFLILWQGQVLEYGEQGDLLPERSRTQVTRQPLQVDTLRVQSQDFAQLVAQIPADALVSGQLESAVPFTLGGALLSAQELEDAQYQAQAAQLRWQRAQLELQRTRILAPQTGLVAQCAVQVGELTTVRQVLLQIIDPIDLQAQLFLPLDQLSALRLHQPVTGQVPATGQQLTGRIERISPLSDPQSGRCAVQVRFPQAGPRLKPGTLIQVQLTNPQPLQGGKER